MARSVRRRPKLFHAALQVTRLEEWCVEASTPDEARMLLASGQGHRCDAGELLYAEVQRLLQD
jgi:hypothetical protein